MKKAFFAGMGFGLVLLVSCAAQWKEPPSWTLRQDGRLRASQRNENFDFAEWAAKYMANSKSPYGVVVTPQGATEIAKELNYRAAEIIRLKNQGCN